MVFLLNEESLKGQFEDVEAFLKTLASNIRCVELIEKHGDHSILKISDFFNCQITAHHTISDLKCYSKRDELLKFRLALEREMREPYWDLNPEQDLKTVYELEEKDVTATSVAEAMAREGHLLSFDSEDYTDCLLRIRNQDVEYMEHSIYSPKYLVEQLGDMMKIPRDDCLKARYENTRLDLSLLEMEYGADTLERDEYHALVSTFDKFVSHDTWNAIDVDDGLEYKKYQPSSKQDDWFSSGKYRGKTIMKFRFSKKLRCFGYRKEDRFRVLRLERDHKVSDKG